MRSSVRRSRRALSGRLLTIGETNNLQFLWLVFPKIEMKNSNTISLMLILFFATTVSPAEVIKANSYIMQWILLGPIANAGPAAISTNVDWLADYGGETKIRPSEGDEIELSGEKYKWRRYQILKIGGNEFDPLGNFDFSVAYLAIYIKFAQSVRVEFLFGSDAGFAAWVNGKEIARLAKNRTNWVQDSHNGQIQVKGGHWNLLLVKATENQHEWGISVKTTEEIFDFTFTSPWSKIRPYAVATRKVSTKWAHIKKGR